MEDDVRADVLKVEPPQGDDTRTWGPPFKDGVASYYFGLNRNKRIQFLDLSAPAGQQRVRELMAEVVNRLDKLALDCAEGCNPETPAKAVKVLEAWARKQREELSA